MQDHKFSMDLFLCITLSLSDLNEYTCSQNHMKISTAIKESLFLYVIATHSPSAYAQKCSTFRTTLQRL